MKTFITVMYQPMNGFHRVRQKKKNQVTLMMMISLTMMMILIMCSLTVAAIVRKNKNKMSSLRYFTGDGLPPQIQSFVTSQDVDNETTALHINDGSIHRTMDDSSVTYDSLWSSRKTQDQIDASQVPVIEHIDDITIHREMDDTIQSRRTLWSSTKTQQQINLYVPPSQPDQDLDTTDTPTFLGLTLQSDYNATLYFRRGASSGPVWTMQNSFSNGNRLVWRDNFTQVAMTLMQTGELVMGNTGRIGVSYSLPNARGVDGQSLVLQGDALQWTSPAGPKKHISASFSDPTLATLVTPILANTWTAADLLLIPQVGLGFGIVGDGTGRMQGAGGRYDVTINCSVGLEGKDPEEICEIAFAQNGVIYPQSLMSFICDDSDKTKPLEVSVRFICDTIAGDFLQVYLRNSLAAPRPFSIANLNVTLVEI
jgi:hypothetical protein